LCDEGDTERVFLLGHSIGAALQISALLFRDSEPSGLRSRLKGLIFNGGAYDPVSFDIMPPDVVEAYFNSPSSPGDAQSNTALGIVQAASHEAVASLPPILILTARKDPEPFFPMRADLVKALKEKGAKEVDDAVLDGHNHISSFVALGSGDVAGEKWGEDVVDWIKAHW